MPPSPITLQQGGGGWMCVVISGALPVPLASVPGPHSIAGAPRTSKASQVDRPSLHRQPPLAMSSRSRMKRCTRMTRYPLKGPAKTSEPLHLGWYRLGHTRMESNGRTTTYHSKKREGRKKKLRSKPVVSGQRFDTFPTKDESVGVVMHSSGLTLYPGPTVPTRLARFINR